MPSATSVRVSTSQVSAAGSSATVVGADRQRGPEEVVGRGAVTDHVHPLAAQRRGRGQGGDGVRPDEHHRRGRPSRVRAAPRVVGHVEHGPGRGGESEEVVEQGVVPRDEERMV